MFSLRFGVDAAVNAGNFAAGLFTFVNSPAKKSLFAF